MGLGGAIPSIVIDRRGKLRLAPTSNLMFIEPRSSYNGNATG
jgi:hypothetical protein